MNLTLPDLSEVPGLTSGPPVCQVVCVNPNYQGFVILVAVLAALGFLAPVLWPRSKSNRAQSLGDAIFVILFMASAAMLGLTL